MAEPWITPLQWHRLRADAMKLLLCGLSLFCVFAVVTHGQKQKEKMQTIHTPAYLFKAQGFLQLNEEQRRIYASGLMDGFYGSALFGGNERTISDLKHCTIDMNSGQLTAIIEQYVQNHPERWHEPTSVEAYNALVNACRQLFPE